MTSDDKQFLDYLSYISQDVRDFTSDVADATDRHFEFVAASIRESCLAEWLPESFRRRPPPPSPPATRLLTPEGYLQQIQNWISRNRALTAAIIAFVGTGSLLIYRKRKGYYRKRRARRASNGARREVIVLAGAPSLPITKSLALDLERRGFIVYVVVNTAEEEQTVQGESRVDIRPLHLDIVDPLGTQQAIDRFNNLLLSPQQAFAGASPHNLNFKGLIIVPDLIYPTGPVETISPELWSDCLNAKVLGTIATSQAFLPTIAEFKARVLLLTPSIIASLKPPFGSVESTIVGALDGFVASLRGELDTLGIKVVQFKLGTFDYGNSVGKHQLQSTDRARVLEWSSSARRLYGGNYLAHNRLTNSNKQPKGSHMRELHNAVFDALTQKYPKSVWRVGRGSVAYDIVGNWVPKGIVGWMMGIQSVSTEDATEPRLEDSVQSSWEKIERTV